MTLASLCSRAGRFEGRLVPNPEDRFSRDEAQLSACGRHQRALIIFNVIYLALLDTLEDCLGLISFHALEGLL